MPARCKFRCMSLTRHTDQWSVRFLVVTEKGADENHLFWKYTPSGEMTFDSQERPEFEPGRTYYVDLELGEDAGDDAPDWSDPRVWVCEKVSQHSRTSVSYTLRRGVGRWHKAPAPHQGALTFQVDNPRAIKALGDCIERVFLVTLSLAPPE